MEAIHTIVFTVDGAQFVARTYRDEDMGAPWDEHDGHGFVRERRHGVDKNAGDRVMNRWLYNVPESIEIAKRDSWGLGDEEAAELTQELGRTPTGAEIIARAVELDFEHLRAWAYDRWHWIGVSVAPVAVDGSVPRDEYTNAVWGIESCGDYWREVAREIAQEIKGA